MVNFTWEEFVPTPLLFAQTFQPEAYPVGVDYYWIVKQHRLLKCVSVCDDVHFTWDGITSCLSICVCSSNNLETCFDLQWSPIYVSWSNKLYVHPVILKHVLVCDEVQFIGWSNQLPQHTYQPSSFHCSAASYFHHCLLVNVWWGPISDQVIGSFDHQGCWTASCFPHVL